MASVRLWFLSSWLCLIPSSSCLDRHLSTRLTHSKKSGHGWPEAPIFQPRLQELMSSDTIPVSSS